MARLTPRLLTISVLALAACSGPPPPAAAPQPPVPGLAGMWSDPPSTALDTFCFFLCTQPGLERLGALLDDPSNDARPSLELFNDAGNYQVREYVRPRLTEAALAPPPLDPLQDPGYLYCQPWGLARQVFAPHQLEITQYPDRVELHYGEWDARRVVYLDGRAAPPEQPHTPLGHSVGHYEGDTLVVETSRLAADILEVLSIGGDDWRRPHSDQLTAVERYRRPTPERLELTVTLNDPWALREPIELKKVWRFAPDQQIGPYDSCEPAATKTAEGKAQ